MARQAMLRKRGQYIHSPETAVERLTYSAMTLLTFTETFLQACDLCSVRKAYSPQHFAKVTSSLVSGRLLLFILL